MTKQMVNYVPIIQANTASCRLQIAKITQDGLIKISFDISPWAQIACSSSFVAGCILDSPYYG